VQLLKEAAANGQSIELHAITTGKVSERAAAASTKGDFRRETWDLVRLQRICGDMGDGSISIDFPAEFGATLPCLVTPKSSDDLQVLLTCIPGRMLAEIYNTHRAALLERNVRSFLQFTGKVNKGIKATVLNEPHRFLPYNNGLSATAGEVEVEHLSGGLGQIRVVRDFQIVNGGQTTATLASCLRRDGTDLAAVSVPLKLTVVPGELLDGLVPKISRYANTQNRIQDSDFSANDPWHIEIERFSRTIWTRGTSGAPRGTRWFYERSRGQYADAVSACPTPAGKRQFRVENPSSQRFNKTDVAKFMLSWDQHPAIVSRGAQKCFVYFMTQSKRTPTDADFKTLVALAILFRRIEELHDDMEFQGFRANAVTYSMARLSHDCGRHLDVEAIWRNQSIPESLEAALKLIIPGVRDVIVNPPPSQRNVTEWCKKDDCWTAVLGRRIQTDLGQIILSKGGSEPLPLSGAPAPSEHEQRLINNIGAISPEVWFSVSSWAKNTSSLQSWQRGLSFSLGRLSVTAKAPTIKQSVQGAKLLLEAVRLGFRDDKLPTEQIEILRSALESAAATTSRD